MISAFVKCCRRDCINQNFTVLLSHVTLLW